MKINFKSGFSVAEMTIVLVLLGVIAAMLIPSAIHNNTKARNKTKIQAAAQTYEEVIMTIKNDNIRGMSDTLLSGMSCDEYKAYFKAVESDGCKFKTPNGLWWDFTNKPNAIVGISKEDLDDTKAKAKGKNTSFYLVAAVDSQSRLRVNDRCYNYGKDYQKESTKKLYAFISDAKGDIACNGGVIAGGGEEVPGGGEEVPGGGDIPGGGEEPTPTSSCSPCPNPVDNYTQAPYPDCGCTCNLGCGTKQTDNGCTACLCDISRCPYGCRNKDICKQKICGYHSCEFPVPDEVIPHWASGLSSDQLCLSSFTICTKYEQYSKRCVSERPLNQNEMILLRDHYCATLGNCVIQGQNNTMLHPQTISCRYE